MRVHMIANAHIDPVWLWPWQAGVDEAIATTAAMADRCDEYPDFVFTRGEAWLYKQVEVLHPELFGRVRRLLERGQWHVTGGQYIQPDVNLPTAAGLHRQIRHGQRYFRDRFGVSPKIGYNVDSFGHTASLPDILGEHGYTAYVFRRPEQHQTALPANTFVWRGVGGAEVVAFRIEPAYVANFADLGGQLELAVEAADPALGHTMCFFGVGNHGGGPSKAMIEWILANRSFGGHELVFSTPQNYFEAIADKRHLLPTVTTELQHTFPGCYSVMHDIKSQQRRTEHLLEQAGHAVEAFGLGDAHRSSLEQRLDSAWEDLLFTAFHDILAGTSIPSAWDSVRAMQGRARIIGEEVLLEATRRWSFRTLPRTDAHQVVVVNTSTRPFSGFVEAEPYLDFDDWNERWICDEDDRPVPLQVVQPDSNQLIPRILFGADVPAGGSRMFRVRDDAAPRAARPRRNRALQASSTRLSNGLIGIRLRRGGIAGISTAAGEVLGPDGLTLHLREDTTDTWTFHTDRWSEPVDLVLGRGTWRVEEKGPLRVRARLDARLGNSAIEWWVSLHAGESAVRMELRINFGERFRLLQMPVDLNAPVANWTDGIAQGATTRTASPAEWPFLDWTRLRTGGVDVALVTPDIYSHSVNGNSWQLTLLRSPKMAWGGGQPQVYAGRDHHTDQGVHRFALAFALGEAASEEGIAALRAGVTDPLVVFDRYEGMNRPGWGPVPPRGLWGPAMQRNLERGRVGEAEAAGQPQGGLFRRPGHDYAG
jgi:alpha-mannosidase